MPILDVVGERDRGRVGYCGTDHVTRHALPFFAPFLARSVDLKKAPPTSRCLFFPHTLCPPSTFRSKHSPNSSVDLESNIEALRDGQ